MKKQWSEPSVDISSLSVVSVLSASGVEVTPENDPVTPEPSWDEP